MMDTERPEHKCERSIPDQIHYMGRVGNAWYVPDESYMKEEKQGWYIRDGEFLDKPRVTKWVQIWYCPMCGIKLATASARHQTQGNNEINEESQQVTR